MMTKIEHSVDVNVPIHVAYSQLARFTEFPRFMEGVQEVRQLDNTHLHWRTRHGDQVHEWESEVTEQIQDQCIAWRNTSGKKNTGRVLLEQRNENCTSVTMSMEVEPEGAGAEALNAADLISARTEQDLNRFKKFIEQTTAISEAPLNEDSGTTRSGSKGESGKSDTRYAGSASWLPGLLNFWEEPLYIMRRMNNEMEHFFGRFLRPSKNGSQEISAQGSTREWTPAVEIARRDNELVISADLPGIKREAVQVKVQARCVTIEGNRPESAGKEGESFHQTDRAYGHFYREIPLPEEVDSDSAEAVMNEGVLQITLPVAPADTRIRRLDIHSGPG